VVVAQPDPFPRVAGRGIAELEAAGISVEFGLSEREARQLNAPYLKLLTTGRPWVIAKWAMTLDGKLATGARDSRWISGEASRAIVHRIRGRVDAIMIGRGTAEADDPLLTARPPGPRTAVRIVLDSQASLSLDRQLVRTAREVPLLVAVAKDAPSAARDALSAAGCEVLTCSGNNHAQRLGWLLDELGRRQMTNVLVEGGSQLLGELFDAGQVDEVHAFIAPKIAGGRKAQSPVGGTGVDLMAQALQLAEPCIEQTGSDVYIRGRIART
jgi:diaminohydroxyphosphoribosylaminopyrimidine deaminase/5-amino-6-(5-phosphoribosylamino)uracil reductase